MYEDTEDNPVKYGYFVHYIDHDGIYFDSSAHVVPPYDDPSMLSESECEAYAEKLEYLIIMTRQVVRLIRHEVV